MSSPCEIAAQQAAGAPLGFYAPALATVVGVLIEVPVMLWLVRTINNSRAWYEHGLSHN